MFIIERKREPWVVRPARKPMSQARKKASPFRISFCLKDAKAVVIYDHLPNMTTILRQAGPLPPTFEFEYSLINQYVESNKGALIQPGTKFGL
jgi:hypothetical protein